MNPHIESAIKSLPHLPNEHRARTLLRRARHLISDPARWTQGYYAILPEGKHCTSDHKSACRWCAMGAIAGIDHCTYRLEPREHFVEFGLEAEQTLSRSLTDTREPISKYNDRVDHASVLALFDRAIASFPTPSA